MPKPFWLSKSSNRKCLTFTKIEEIIAPAPYWSWHIENIYGSDYFREDWRLDLRKLDATKVNARMIDLDDDHKVVWERELTAIIPPGETEYHYLRCKVEEIFLFMYEDPNKPKLKVLGQFYNQAGSHFPHRPGTKDSIDYTGSTAVEKAKSSGGVVSTQEDEGGGYVP